MIGQWEKLFTPSTPFLMTPWAETVLYTFTGGSDGAEPSESLILDRAGNLYGTTDLGGASNYGVVFKLAGTGLVPTPLSQQITNLQAVIAGLPASAFRLPALKEVLRLELDAVALSLQAKDYKAALLVLQDVILPEVNECATTGAPGNGWINNCPDQSLVYTPLVNIIAQVQALAASGG